MRLLITDPLAVVADRTDVTSLRAEDESGGFGILTGHADLADRVAGLGGVLAACGRRGLLRRAARRAVRARRAGHRHRHEGGACAATTSTTLEASVLVRFRAEAEAERTGRVDEHAAAAPSAIRRIVEALRPDAPDGGSA